MGLLGNLSRLGQRLLTLRRVDEPHTTSGGVRVCRFEEMEPRQMMAADSGTITGGPLVVAPAPAAPPLHVGVVWWDPACGCFGTDAPSDVQISFQGGATGTQLNQVVIDGSRLDGTIEPGDILFDAVGGGGPGTKSPLTVVSAAGFQVTSISENNASNQLTINLSGFTAGDVLELHVNTDRVLSVDSASGAATMDPIVDGADFQGSSFTASLTAPHYQATTLGNTFYNDYDSNFAAADQASGSQLNLPPQRWTTTEDETAWTAGAVAINEQTALPAGISGTVFQDDSQDSIQQAGEPGVAGVSLALWQWDGAEYVATSRSAVTDSSGNYSFTGLVPGKYQVVETKPANYFAEAALPGTNGGAANGQAVSPTVLSEITVQGGDSGVLNNFALVRPVTLSGYVYQDSNDDGLREAGEPGIAGVQIMIVPVSTIGGNPVQPITLTTDASGAYSADGLPPGAYNVVEVTQPAGYLSGLSHAGTTGGSAVNPGDKIVNIPLASGQSSQENDIGKLLPGVVSGYVRIDTGVDHQNNAGDPPLANVVVQLQDASGKVIATTETGSQGDYQFRGLPVGTYRVSEIVPGGYFFEDSFAGSAGGETSAPGAIGSISIGAGVTAAQYNFYDVLPPTISGYVRLDATGDRQNKTADPALAGVTVQLRDSSGSVLQTAQTGAGGYYEFDGLAPGNYQVFQVVPSGYDFEVEFAGSAGGNTQAAALIRSISVAGGVNAGQNNFFDVLPAIPAVIPAVSPATLSGTVFQDGPPIATAGNAKVDVPAVRIGVLAAGDARLAGVTLELRDGVTGAAILGSQALPGYYQPNEPITAVTDKNGNYVFRGLNAGTYAVYIETPAGYIAGIDKAGSAGGVVLSAYNSVSPKILAGLTVPPVGGAIVAITLQEGAHSVHNNFSVDLVKTQSIFVPTAAQQAPQLLPPLVVPPLSPLAVNQPATEPDLSTTANIYGSSTMNFTWHLSIVDAGQPRGATSEDQSVAMLVSATPEQLAEMTDRIESGQWVLAGGNRDARQASARRLLFGIRGGVPISGDFNGDGTSDVGVYVDGNWYLDLNGNGAWDKGDLYARLGRRGDKPVTGDWDGDGKTDIGIFGPAWGGDPNAIKREPGLPDPHNQNADVRKNVPPPHHAVSQKRSMKVHGGARPRADVIDHVFAYGNAQDTPVVGDWNGDGTSTVAVFRSGAWQFDSNGDGKLTSADETIKFGQAGDKPVVGDWNGDGTSDIGVYRGGTWLLDSNGNRKLDGEDEVVQLGGAGDSPAPGDWDGDGRHEPAVYREASSEPDETEISR